MITSTTFEAILPEYGETWDDASTVEATSHKEAAEKAAERFCEQNAEWGYMYVVHTRDTGGASFEARFEVTVEQVPVFTARQIKEANRT